MLLKVNQVSCAGDPPKRSFLSSLGWTYKGYHRAVVIHIRVSIQHSHLSYRANCLLNGGNNFWAASF
jgi:hypothetical protein